MFDSVQALVFGLVSLCVAVLKHLLLTNLFLDSIHSYFVSSQAKICQIHFWILVKNFFSFFGLPTLNFVFDSAQALVFGLVCVCVCVVSSSLFHYANSQWYQPLQWCLSVRQGLWWEIEKGDEILGTLFNIGLKTWNRFFFF